MTPAFKSSASGNKIASIEPSVIVPRRGKGVNNRDTGEWKYPFNILFHIDLSAIKSFQNLPNDPDETLLHANGSEFRIGMSFDSFVFLKTTAQKEGGVTDFRDFDGLYLHDDVQMDSFTRPSNFAPTRKQAPII